MKNNLPLDLIKNSVIDQSFIKLNLTSPKVSIRRVASKQGDYYQKAERKGTQEFHTNLKEKPFLAWLDQELLKHKQGVLFTLEANWDLHLPEKSIKQPPSLKADSLKHNRTKQHVLSMVVPPEYFKALGIKKDKFLQIEKFLREVEATLSHFKEGQELFVIDFGCGKAYLTFALYDYLQGRFKVTMKGIDLKMEVMQNCQRLADELGFTGLKFIHGDIDELKEKKADLVVALHACDTATDAALEKAVSLSAEVILAAPCCQHELYSQVKNELMMPLLKHGILRERLASLLTDASRGALLESLGYEVKIVEFIEATHTPKNLLIRAVKGSKPTSLDSYKRFKEFFSITPNFDTRLQG